MFLWYKIQVMSAILYIFHVHRIQDRTAKNRISMYCMPDSRFQYRIYKDQYYSSKSSHY